MPKMNVIDMLLGRSKNDQWRAEQERAAYEERRFYGFAPSAPQTVAMTNWWRSVATGNYNNDLNDALAKSLRNLRDSMNEKRLNQD